MNADRLDAIASAPLVLVASDFDGVISEITPMPDQARPNPACVAALERLAAIPATSIAIISGRPLTWLRDRLPSLRSAHMFGSHGAEDSRAGFSPAPLPAPIITSAPTVEIPNVSHRYELYRKLERVISDRPGWLIERKPYALAVHYRTAHPASVDDVLRDVREVAASDPNVLVREGSMVLELCFSHRSKRDAMLRAVYVAGATNTVFFGDDLTDEDAFGALGASDLTIKIGPGESRAAFRVASVREVADTLAELADRRERFVLGRRTVPIHMHSILSDQRTVAIISPSARLNWLCLPRVDSPALFAELVGDPAAGYFSVEPLNQPAPPRQSYVKDSLVLETRWETCTLTDYLDCSGGRAFQRAGRTDLLRVLEGSGRVNIRFAPRHDFGRSPTAIEVRSDGLQVLAGIDPCVLLSPGVSWTLTDQASNHTAEAQVDLDAMGGRCAFELRFGTANLRPAMVDEPVRRQQTIRHWSGWASTLSVPEGHRDQLIRSALVLRSLCHGPTGAIVAAGTTSLPEQIGGIRNWDYRFCWPRDAAMSATALMHLGNTGHAMKLADWLAGIVERLESPERLRPIYAVRGEELGAEAELGHLAGYANSRPVRIGNAAAQQVQLDVFGPIADMVACMAERGAPISPDAWRLVRAMVNAVEARWSEPDHGIWEIRGPKRHHVHSRVMCWHAVNRAMVVHAVTVGSENSAWRTLRDQIAADVFENGWSARMNAFTDAYSSDQLDASVLTIGLTGLLDHADQRWAATVDAINTHLRDGATVYRYRGDDGIPGTEGGFVICTCWLVEALATLGRIDEAESLLAQVLAQAGPTGLFAEQWDPVYRTSLGNFPQAYSHLGVINAAIALENARRKRDSK